MKANRKMLKVKQHNEPLFFNSLTEPATHYIIGNTDYKDEDIFQSDFPNHITLVCELFPTKNFNSEITTSASYQPLAGDESTKDMEYKLYDGSNISMNGFVSSIEIKYKEMLPCKNSDLIHEIISQNQETIYNKNFLTQEADKAISLEIDEQFETNMYNHYISKAIPFAGIYHKGINISDIEQYFFYIGVGLRSEEYIDVISSRKLLGSAHVKPDANVKGSLITSLEDDISNGKITIRLNDEEQYKSLSITKNTVISNKCEIIFKKEVL